VELTEKGARLGGATIPLSREALGELSGKGEKTATLGFRPESTEVVREGEGSFPMEVAVVEELGSDAYAYGQLQLAEASGPTDQLTIVRVDARRPPMKGETIHLRIREGEERLFSTTDGSRLSGSQQSQSSANASNVSSGSNVSKAGATRTSG
jgi:multiple sugar transport system ATP-binding protein